MTSSLLHRTALATADQATGRTVFGRVVPYGEVATVNDGWGPYRERFESGAFARSIAERSHKIRLYAVHSAATAFPIGKAVDLREQRDGLHASFLLADTQAADEALSLVRDGVVDSFSVGFRPVRDRKDGDVTVRVEAALLEVSLVGIPAYAGAAVAGVRSTATPTVLSVDVARRRLGLVLRSW